MTSDEFGAPVVVLQVDGGWRRFLNPARIIVADTVMDVAPALREIERAVQQEAFFAVGYVAYEAGASFGLTTHTTELNSTPLYRLCVYRARRRFHPSPIN